MLQDDGLANTSSMTVNQLHVPALNNALAAHRRDEPSGGGGISGSVTIERAEQDARAAPALGGELQPPRLDPRQPLDRRHRRAHPPATQAFDDRPDLVRRRARMKHVKPIERDSHRRDGRGVELRARIAPDDGARRACLIRLVRRVRSTRARVCRLRFRNAQRLRLRSRKRLCYPCCGRGSARQQQREESRGAVARMRKDLVHRAAHKPIVREQLVDRAQSRGEDLRARHRFFRECGSKQPPVMTGDQLHGGATSRASFVSYVFRYSAQGESVSTTGRAD